MAAQRPALPPVPWVEPELNEALANQRVLVIKDDEAQVPVLTRVCLMRGRNTTTGQQVRTPQAYQLSAPKPFYTAGSWSEGQVVKELYKAYILEFVEQQPNGEFVFREPSEQDAQLVVIKRIRRWVRDTLNPRRWYFEPWNHENPYNEIAAMRFLNPSCEANHCTIGCVDALRDNGYIYIVTTFLRQRDLHEHIPWHRGGLPEEIACDVFRKIVQQVYHLHQQGVVHLDLKGENIGMEDNSGSAHPTLRDMDPILIDLAQSRRVSRENGNSQLMPSTPAFGTPSFRPPEVQQEEEFNPYKVDVWSLGVILFTLLTGERLYLTPFDSIYTHFIANDGLTDGEFNQLWSNELASPLLKLILRALESEPTDTPIHRNFYWIPHLMAKIPAVEQLGPVVRNLMRGMLEPNASKRLTLAQVQEHVWLRPDFE